MSDLDLTPGQPKLAEVILPELVWEIALEFVTDPEDVLNAGKTCTLFQRFLHSKMVSANLGKTLPILMNYMDSNSILNCRSVSKGWRDVVDKLFENYFLNTTYKEYYNGFAPFQRTKICWALHLNADGVESRGRKTDPKRFMREMKDHPRNPFIGRAVSFCLNCPEGQDQVEPGSYFRILFDFFELFGKHVWSLQLDFTDMSDHQNELHGGYLFKFIIRDLFLLAPNLKSLLITLDMDVELPITITKEEIIPTPYPGLDRLGIFKAFPETRDALLLRHSNTQFKILHIVYMESLYDVSLPNLKELHFTYADNIDDTEDLCLNLMLPRLELLCVAQIEWWNSGKKEAFEIFLRALNNLCISSPNLKTLRFNNNWLWQKELDEPIGNPEGLQCPEKITTLEIPEGSAYNLRGEQQRLISDYSFLLQFPHVETIRIIPSGSKFTPEELEMISASEIVQVHKFMYCERMYESNIWSLLPALKTFSFKKRVYIRSAYERRCRRME